MDLERKDIGLGSRPALIVVDMMKGFTDPACPLGCDCPEVIETNRHLIDEFHRAGALVVFTRVVYRSEREARVFRERVPALNLLAHDSDWVRIDERLPRRSSDLLIDKHWASAFHKTDLDQRLRAKGVDSLIVTGLTTSGCVRATAVDGLQQEYRVVVPREAVADRNQDAHRANLFDLQAKYADVLTVDELMTQLLPVLSR